LVGDTRPVVAVAQCLVPFKALGVLAHV
jgi:hypothetical protein